MKLRLLRASLIIVAGFLVFYPALNGDWLWDDALYVTANPLLHDPARLWKAWFQPGGFVEYYPLQQTAQWIEWKFWGGQTFGYHLVNVVLHIASALLVWRLLGKLGLRLAWLGGLIFVLHPLNVESVAYISEFKNALSLPPFLLAMCAWINYEEQKRPRDYLLALGLFWVAMLCKPTMALFPLVILLYAWWKRGRVGRDDLKAAAPFLAISVILGAATIYAGVHFEGLYPDHPAMVPMGGFVSRLALMGLVMAFYFARFFWPVDPLPIYPRWAVDPPAALQFLPWLLFAGLFCVLWRKRQAWGRHGLLGVGFFTINLLPFSGLIPISYMYFTWIMDHFLYLPMIGLIGLVVAALEGIRAQVPKGIRLVSTALVALILLLGAVQSQDYAAVWTDPLTFWTYAVQHNPGAWLAHYNLGNNLRAQGRLDEAVAQYREAIRINPRYEWAHDNLGIALTDFPDRQEEAISEFEAAVRIRPAFAEAHNNLANVLMQIPGRVPEAITEYQAALRAKPGFIEAKYNLGIALSKIPGRTPEAIGQFREILRLRPGFEPAQDMLEKLQAGQP